MNDAEWDSMQSVWQDGSGPLPDVLRRARAAARRRSLDNFAGLTMIVGGFALSTFLITRGRYHDAAIGWLDLVFTLTLLAGFLWIQRGVITGGLENPRDAVAFLERRIRAERRGSLFAPPVFLGLLIGAGYYSHTAIDEGGWPLRIFMIVLLTVGTGFLLALPWSVHRRTARELDDLHRWRAWMDEQQL